MLQKYLLAIAIIIASTSTASGQQMNRYGQPRAITIKPTIDFVPVIRLPFGIIRGPVTTIDLGQLRTNLRSRQTRPRRRRRF